MRPLIKVIYSAIPFKKYIFLVIRFLFKPNERMYRHLHFKGKINVPVNNEKSFVVYHYGFLIENEIFWAGLTKGWEKE